MMRVKKYFRIFSFILISIFSIGFFSCEKSSSLSQSDSSSKVKKNTHQHSLKIENLAKSKNLEFVESEVENSYTIKNISEEDFLLDKKYRTEIADYICAKNGSFDSYDENSSFFENLKIYPIDLPFSKIFSGFLEILRLSK
mgnify:FL=1